MTKTKPIELSLEETCAILNVSERTVRTYIKQRRFEAVKVAGKWFVDKASLDLFSKTNEMK